MHIASLCATTINPLTSDEQQASPVVVAHTNALCDRMTDAVPGDAIIYHIGFLARDRCKTVSELPEEQRAELNVLADYAMRLMEGGWVHLLQRRIGPERLAYLAIVRPRPRHQRRSNRVMPRPIQQRHAAA